MKRILFLFVCLFFVASVTYALEYAIPMGSGVIFTKGSSPLPPDAIFPIPPHFKTIPLKYIKAVSNNLVEVSVSEKHIIDLPLKYKKKVNGIWQEKTQAEKDQADANEAQALIDAELARQDAKPLNIKEAENAFLDVCFKYFGSYSKKSFQEFNAQANIMITNNMQNEAIFMILEAQGAIGLVQSRTGKVNAWFDIPEVKHILP